MELKDTALLLLASGLSVRFENGDKLMAALDGRPVLARAATLLASSNTARRYAVVGKEQVGRQTLLDDAGWTTITNENPAAGQGASISIGIDIISATNADAVFILLADMPNVPDRHLERMAAAMSENTAAVMSICDETLTPPALFHRSAFSALARLNGDRGAKRVFEELTNRETIPLDASAAADIDTIADLANLASMRDV